ncbi:predicted protein [Nematostella vectensis]|uniref:N-acetyltransferase domain-containing protein n=1 Tax=Nematostella vectensis TaxID=45351 RepID=A7RYM2_NEMVE|nr:predicted protein [Nematostella vectensis]|eukprot:XP_001635609.1 predicted protein [Nematostella vectensis]
MVNSTEEKVIVRPCKQDSNDVVECRRIFSEGIQEQIWPGTKLLYPRYCKMAVFILPAVLALGWHSSLWIVLIYFMFCLTVAVGLYLGIKRDILRFIGFVCKTDLRNVDKFYGGKGSCLLVAECNGKVAGLVGLIQRDSSVLELKRMGVCQSFRRRGIASRLLERAVKFAEEFEYKKIALNTSSPVGAVELYQKFGFHIVDTKPLLDNVWSQDWKARDMELLL